MQPTYAGKPAIKRTGRKISPSAPLLTHDPAGLLTLLENYDGYVWGLDKQLRYTFLNTSLRKRIGEVLGVEARPGDKALDELEMLDNSKRLEWKKMYQLALKGKAQRQIQEFTLEGRTYYFEISVNPVRVGEEITGLACFAKDIPGAKDARLQRQKEITRAVMEAQENEREMIGRELHDNVTQILTTARLCLSCADISKGENEMLDRTTDYISSAIDEIRKLSKLMTQTFHREVGLKFSVEDLVESIRLSRKFEVSLNFSLPEEKVLDETLKVTIFRIIQEQLNNIIRHAQATVIDIAAVQTKSKLSLSISDNGKGFDTRLKRKGIGLTNIINRAELFNGKVEIDSSPGKGCRLKVSFRLKT